MNGLESLDYNQHQIDTCKYESIKMLPWMMRTNEVGGESGIVEDTLWYLI